jgi:hypothetical protein
MALQTHAIAPFEYEVRDDAARARPARVFADDELLAAIARDRSLEQLVNVTALPGLVGPVYGMPDMHEGYGFPVGGVGATALPDGVISPGGIGFDINCGVRLLADRAGWATRCAAITCARWTRPTLATGSSSPIASSRASRCRRRRAGATSARCARRQTSRSAIAS